MVRRLPVRFRGRRAGVNRECLPKDGVAGGAQCVDRLRQVMRSGRGVETSEQLEKLRSSGCSIVQGYLFSEAIPARSIGGMIDDFNRADRRAA